MATDKSKELRRTTAEAEKTERALVSFGAGTKDWSAKEQREILAKGRATGRRGRGAVSAESSEPKALSDSVAKKPRDSLTKRCSAFFRSSTEKASKMMEKKAEKRGYLTKLGAGLGFSLWAGTSILGAWSHTPSEVASTNRELAKGAAHAYDIRHAVKHPDAMIESSPSTAPAKTVEEATAASKKTTKGIDKAMAKVDASAAKARTTEPRAVNKKGAKTSESKTLKAQQAAKATASKAPTKSEAKTASRATADKPVTESKTLKKQAASASAKPRSEGTAQTNRRSKGHGH